MRLLSGLKPTSRALSKHIQQQVLPLPIEIWGILPFRQKKDERMGHGAFMDHQTRNTRYDKLRSG
jgi:hypothetical protein